MSMHMGDSMREAIQEEIRQAITVAKLLFDRNKVTGSAANLSVYLDGKMIITRSGSCFGLLTEADFAVMDLDGNVLNGVKPSKEWPLHAIVYRNKTKYNAVVHTHSLYATLWGTRSFENSKNVVPNITPYLAMRIGEIGLIPYEQPGSKELFAEAEKRIDDNDGFLMQRHGLLVGGKNILDAFFNAEELEYTCQIAWELEAKDKQALIRS